MVLLCNRHGYFLVFNKEVVIEFLDMYTLKYAVNNRIMSE